MKNFRFNSLSFGILLMFTLILIATNSGYCGPNPGVESDERLIGPAIIGQIEIVPDVAGIWVTFTGRCQGQDFTTEFDLPLDFDDFQNAEDLEGQRSTGAPPNCGPSEGAEWIIHKVTDFNRDGDLIQADAIILFVVGK